jgi:hypothetical protein
LLINRKGLNSLEGLNYIPLLLEKLMATQPEKIILFGSYAYGEPTINSEIDSLFARELVLKGKVLYEKNSCLSKHIPLKPYTNWLTRFFQSKSNWIY